MIKGEPLNEFTFKMSRVAVDIGKAPVFRAGDEVILFLYEKSSLGFTSPVGLGQGKFSIRFSPAGEKLVVNENNNLDLFRGMDKTKYLKKFSESNHLAGIERVITRQSGPINYHSFLTLIEGMLR